MGKRHDSGMLADSGLLNQLQQHSFDTGGRPLCIYRDPAYLLRVHLQSGFRSANITREEKLWNLKMSSVRQAVEWRLSPVGKMYIVSALLNNARYCFYGTITSDYFECNPPIIEEYFTH